MKAISHQRKAMQVTQCRIGASMTAVFASHMYVCACMFMCILHVATTPNIKSSHNKPLCRRDLQNLHTSEGEKRQIKWHSTSLHGGDNRRKDTRRGTFFFSPPNTKGSSSYFRPLAYTANLDVWKKGSGAATRDPRLYRWGYAVTVRNTHRCAEQKKKITFL